MDQLPETLAELEALKKLIEQKQTLLKECPKQAFKEGLYQILQTKNYTVPPQYLDFLNKIQDEKPEVIIKSILESDTIHFPILMTLLQVWPCNKIILRERLIQLFDSFILHNGAGLSLADIVKFPVDRILDACRDHDPSTVLLLLNEQLRVLYGLDMEKHHTDSSNFEVTKWLNSLTSSLQFIIYIIEEADEPKSKTFTLALNFLMGKIISYDDYSVVVNGHYGIFNQLVDEVNSNGSDYMFSKIILPSFKGIDITSI